MNPNFSPPESILSTPDEHGHSLFAHDASMAASPAMSAMTPQSLDEYDRDFSSTTPQPDSETRPGKKRKSWGQELPTPKTNLPPRKRAKTEDEKEQRRIERVLRNRAAAQSSRERKRKEVEGLEAEKGDIVKHNAQLTSRLREVEMENSQLAQQVAKMAAEMTVFRKMMQGNLPSSDSENARAISPTLSTGLYSHHEAVPNLKEELEDLDFTLPPPQSHVDPRDADFHSQAGSPKADPTATTPNLAQHPAEVLCDLQCQLGVTRPHWGPVSGEPTTQQQQHTSLIVFMTAAHLLLATAASTASSLLVQPLAEIFRSLKTGSPLSVEADDTTARAAILFPLIHWLISTPINPLSISPAAAESRPNTSHATTTIPPPRSTFRISLLRRLLACSPALARPLRDATGQALRLMSSGESTTDGVLGFGAGVVVTGVGSSPGPRSGYAESLMTMMWAIDSIQRANDKTSRDDHPSLTTRPHRQSLEKLFDDDDGQLAAG